MKMKDMEKDLLLKFYEMRQINNTTLLSSLDEIDVLERCFTGIGVFTTFARHACLKIARTSDKVHGPDLWLNADKVSGGSLFHIDGGYIDTVECFILGDDYWPEEITCYEITGV